LSKDEAVTSTNAARTSSHFVGPNIDDAIKKLKGDPAAVLLEILEPSRNIEDKYQQTILALEDGSSRIGVISDEDPAKLTILTGTPPQVLGIEKKSIDSRRRSPLSIMPPGQLNTLDKEQILDLLAYLLAGGNAQDPAFHHHH
jgi:putative heme-binding domain-containing protein